MKIGKGVEWAAHACAVLALLPDKSALSGEALADFLGVPSPYLAKQLQALSRAGIVAAQRGVTGGYRLAQTAEALSLWDVTAAIEGTASVFQCTEVRQNGACGASPKECSKPCDIAAAFIKAEKAYRNALMAVPISEVVAGAARTATSDRKQLINKWIKENAA